MLKFHAYRLNLIVASSKSQLSLFPQTQTKEELFHNSIQKLLNDKKSTFTYRKGKLLVFLEKELYSGVYVASLAKEEIYTKPVEGSTSIMEVKDTRTPYIDLIIDQRRQIILIQEKTSVFQDINNVKIKLEFIFTALLSEYFITVFLKPISDKNDFWSKVNEADNIEEFDITLNAPNLFKGRFKASEFVKEVHELYNITEFSVHLKNKLGQLKLYKDNLQEFIALASAGAGKYILKAVKDGQKFVVKSYEATIKKIYQVDSPSEIDNEQLENDLDELDRLNDEQE